VYRCTGGPAAALVRYRPWGHHRGLPSDMYPSHASVDGRRCRLPDRTGRL